MRISDWSSDVCSSDLIVIGLAEREMKVQPVVVARAIGGVRAAQRRLHRRAFVGAETDRLQIGEAPPQFAEPRIGGKRVEIGGDALLLPPNRLQHMADRKSTSLNSSH